jgi:hypothetical protein
MVSSLRLCRVELGRGRHTGPEQAPARVPGWVDGVARHSPRNIGSSRSSSVVLEFADGSVHIDRVGPARRYLRRYSAIRRNVDIESKLDTERRLPIQLSRQSLGPILGKRFSHMMRDRPTPLGTADACHPPKEDVVGEVCLMCVTLCDVSNSMFAKLGHRPFTLPGVCHLHATTCLRQKCRTSLMMSPKSCSARTGARHRQSLLQGDTAREITGC